jgi:hypothetical protein
VFEGERAYGGEIFKLTEHTERLHKSGEILGFKIPYSVAEIDQATVELLGRQGLRGCLCASHRLARFGDDGRFGPEEPDQPGHRDLAMAELFRSRAADEGHPARHGRVQASRSDDRALALQGRPSIDSKSALKLPSPNPSSPLRSMNSKKIGPITVLEKICSRIRVSPPSTTPSPSIRMPCFFIRSTGSTWPGTRSKLWR